MLTVTNNVWSSQKTICHRVRVSKELHGERHQLARAAIRARSFTGSPSTNNGNTTKVPQPGIVPFLHSVMPAWIGLYMEFTRASPAHLPMQKFNLVNFETMSPEFQTEVDKSRALTFALDRWFPHLKYSPAEFISCRLIAIMCHVLVKFCLQLTRCIKLLYKGAHLKRQYTKVL